jgi:hypothetical protein
VHQSQNCGDIQKQQAQCNKPEILKIDLGQATTTTTTTKKEKEKEREIGKLFCPQILL